MFNHVVYESVKPEDLERIETDKGRYYRDSEGLLYQSVTTFLGQFSDSSIQEWRDSIGAEKADEICRLAALKGTNIHTACEKFLNNEEGYTKHLSYDELFDWKILKPVLQSRVNNIVAQEIRMKSKKLGLAGTADCIAEVDSVLSLVDFKTSKRIKSKEDIWSYWIQTAIYAMMAYEQFGLRINQLVIIMIVDKETTLVYKENSVPWMKEVLKLCKENNNKG